MTTANYDGEYVHEEYFEVDRSKLHKMVTTITFIEGKSKADLYFEQIMESTQTHVDWHQSLNQAAKTRHHPFIRVCGKRMEDVTWAKGLILARLEVNNSVFRLKMSISNCDHHYIMGRNNNIVNRIMNDTQTHIQFPEPNLIKKGNQVTVHGLLEDLEQARSLLRLASPVVMSFELPANRSIPSSESVGSYYRVHVMFLSSAKPNTILVLVRGSTRRVEKLKQATLSLLDYTLGKTATSSIVSVQLQIPPQHHEAVKGENCENIIEIMEQTNTKIFFPDLTIRGNRRSQVTITGTVDEVLTARNELIGNFPIELTFDISDEYENATEIMDLGRRAGVRITISHKERGIGMSVTIKGPEKMIERIYEIHRIIRQLNSKSSGNTFDLFENGYYRHQVDLIMNSEERSDSDPCERDSGEQSPAVSSPDSGHATQDEAHINTWTVYDPNFNNPGVRQMTYEEFLGSTGQIGHYYPTYQNWNNWIQPNNGLEVQPVPEMPAVPTHPAAGGLVQDISEWKFDGPVVTKQTDAEQTTIIPEEKEEVELTFGNFENGLNLELLSSSSGIEFEKELELPETEKVSPLIVGEEETVAGRLICSGWGSLF